LDELYDVHSSQNEGEEKSLIVKQTRSKASVSTHDEERKDLKLPSRFRRRGVFTVSLMLLILGLCGIFSPTKQAMTSAFRSVICQPQTVTRYETKNIEDIRKDDQVLAYDVRTGEVTKRKVTQVFKRQSDHLRYLAMTDDSGLSQTFQTTDSHPFWVVTKSPDWSRAASDVVTVHDVATGQSLEIHHEDLVQKNDANLVFGYYVEAGKLQVGDVFLGPNEELTTLTSTRRQDFPQGVNVYNFTVEDDHNYFVIANYEAFQNGAQPVLVHNSKKCDSPGNYLVSKAPKQVTPGIRVLNGQIIDDIGRVQRWKAHYDEYGRLIGRTDYNARNLSQGIPDTHHHIYEWGPGKNPLEIGSHLPGEFFP
jgi:YD repeat-containing protein